MKQGEVFRFASMASLRSRGRLRLSYWRKQRQTFRAHGFIPSRCRWINSIRISYFKEERFCFYYAQKFGANCPHGNPVPPALSRRSAQLWLAASKLRYVVTNRNTNLNWAHIPLGHTNVSMVVTLYFCHSILLDNRNHKKFL